MKIAESPRSEGMGCAIFDAEAQLVAQAAHVPVHLGSMLKAVSATVAAVGGTEEGDVVIVRGGRAKRVR